MPRRKKSAVAQNEETLQGRVLERPDGFYWESKATKTPRGPFETRAEAEHALDILRANSAKWAEEEAAED